MNLTALKTWVSGETLTATDLNGEFQNIYTHTITNSDIDSTGTYVLGELVVGSGITAADGGQFHVHTASAGSVQAHADANEAVLENSAASGLSILSGSSSDGNIFFGDAADNDIGKIAYSHSANSLTFTTNGATALTLSSAQAATFAGDVSVGGALTLTGGLTLNGAVVVGDSASDTLTVNATVTSDLLFTDATYDIGKSGATRPRDGFFSRNMAVGGTLGVTGLITATGGVSGALTGNVTGNVTGDVTGDLTGNVTGNVTGNLTGDVTGNISGNVTGGTISGTTGTFTSTISTSGGYVTVAGNPSAGTISSNGNGQIGGLTGNGLYMYGKGSTYDLALANANTSIALAIPTGGSATPDVYIPNLLGIGTSSPSHTLDVNGSMQIERNGSSPLLRFTDTSSSSRWIGIPDGSSRFAIYGTNGSTEELVLDSSGNCGIGSSSPVALSNQTSLTVNGTSVGRVDVKASGGGGGTMFGTSSALTVQANSGVAVNLDSASGQPITFQVGSSEKARILSSGGITFNGDTATANALDDYEEGTYSVTDQSGAGLSFSVTSNRYVKIGKLVWVSIELTYPTTTSTAGVRISLPFTNSTAQRTTMACVTNRSDVTVSGYVSNLPTAIGIIESAASPVAVTNASLSGKYVIIGGVYEVA